VALPETMKRSMSRQAKAERERRSRVINADDELQASRKLAEAAEVMAEHPAALQLRLLQTVVKVAAEKNSTLVLPFPRGTAPLPRTRRSRGDRRHHHPGDHRAHTAVQPTRRHLDGPRTSGRGRCSGDRRGRDRPGTSRRPQGGDGSAGAAQR
jgi:hypothetical protein